MDFRNKILLAPLEGITNLPYRLLCRRYKADIVISEMINANAIINAGQNIKNKLATCQEEKPVGIQIAASEKNEASKAAKLIENKVDFININMGCPSHNIMSNGCGASLLNKPGKISEIVKSVVNSVNVPVTVKIRADNAVRNAKIIEENGAAAIVVHARTIKQKGSGNADFDILRNVKEAVNIPVIGNGGIKTAKDAKEMLMICDSVMIGTAAIGNPSIFAEIKAAINHENYQAITGVSQFLELYALAESYGTADYAWLKFIAPNFIYGFEGAAQERLKVSKSKTTKELLDMFNELSLKA